jgi:hypothetical protein
MTANLFALADTRRTRTAHYATAPVPSFAAVAAETAEWLAERVMTFEACGMSRSGAAERLRRQAHSYRAYPELVAAEVG